MQKISDLAHFFATPLKDMIVWISKVDSDLPKFIKPDDVVSPLFICGE